MNTSRIIIISQLCLFGGLLLCILIRPTGLIANNGISYFGTFKATILPYTITLLGPAVMSFILAEHYGSNKLLKYSLILISLMAVGLLLTPYTVSSLFDSIHDTCGSILFVAQLIIGGWLVYRRQFAYWSIILLLIQLMAGITAYIYLAPKHGYLIEAQIVFQVAYGQLLYWARPDPQEHNFNKSGSFIPKRV